MIYIDDITVAQANTIFADYATISGDLHIGSRKQFSILDYKYDKTLTIWSSTNPLPPVTVLAHEGDMVALMGWAHVPFYGTASTWSYSIYAPTIPGATLLGDTDRTTHVSNSPLSDDADTVDPFAWMFVYLFSDDFTGNVSCTTAFSQYPVHFLNISQLVVKL